MKINFKEFLGYVICFGVILGIAYYSGFLSGLSLDDFEKSANNISDIFTGAVKNIKISDSSGNRGASKYHGYTLQIIPKIIKETSFKNSVWNEMIHSNKKVVFYMYSGNSDEFHTKIQGLKSNEKISQAYTFRPMTEAGFKSAHMVFSAPEKICNSLEECNNMRKKAVANTEVSSFLTKCSKTMCIFNGPSGQYVVLPKRNGSDAMKALEALRNW